MAAIPARRCAPRFAAAVTFASALCAFTPASAQPANPFVGSWLATFSVQTSRGTDERQADFAITPTGGSWKAHVETRQDPCVGREVPIVVDEVTESRLTGTVRYSTLGDFCKDLKLVLRKDASGNFSGRRGGTELKLERK